MATIRKKGEYQWHVQIRRKGHPPQTRTFELKADAEAWARSVERDMDCGEFKDRRNSENTTLLQVLEFYRDNKAITNKGKNVDFVRIGVLLNSTLAKYSMSALTPDVIENWCNQRLMKAQENGKRYKGSTINRYLNLLSAAINVGIKKMKLGIDNPCKQVERYANPQHRDRRLVGDEETRLLNAMVVTERVDGRFTGPQNIWLKPIVEFAIESGMRRSEILGLEWRYVDLKRGIAHIPDTKIGAGDEAPVSRDVPLSLRAIDVLRSLPRNIDGKVFDTTADAIKKGFSRAVARARKVYEDDCKMSGETPLAKVLVDLHFHDLRHEATSRLAKVYDIRQLAKVGGWLDLNTLARYYNPTADELVDALRRHEAISK
jgi:integrase